MEVMPGVPADEPRLVDSDELEWLLVQALRRGLTPGKTRASADSAPASPKSPSVRNRLRFLRPVGGAAAKTKEAWVHVRSGEAGAKIMSRDPFDGRLPSGRGFSESISRVKTTLAQAQEQCNAHLLPAVLLAGLSASAFCSINTREQANSLAGKCFLFMTCTSTCLEFAATFMLVHVAIFYGTPFGEKYYRGFDSDVTMACFCFQWGGWAFVGSLPLRVLLIFDGDPVAAGSLGMAISAVCVATILGLTCWFLTMQDRWQEGYQLHLDEMGIGDDFRIDMLGKMFSRVEVQKKSPKFICWFSFVLFGLILLPIAGALAAIGICLFGTNARLDGT